jgi:membrane-associated protease RseP (regulator of RpoE activity)
MTRTVQLSSGPRITSWLRGGLAAAALTLMIAGGALFYPSQSPHAQAAAVQFDRSGRGETIFSHVPPDSPAATAGLREGDRLIEIGDDKAPTPDSAARDIRNAESAGKSAINLIVSRDGHRFYVALLLQP